MSDTPRTQATKDHVEGQSQEYAKIIFLKLCLELEKELAAAQKDADRYKTVKRLSMEGRLPPEWKEGWSDEGYLDRSIDAAQEGKG
jgi:hypothetical protein